MYVSVSANCDARANPFVAVKRAVEAHLQSSGLVYTILRPSAVSRSVAEPNYGIRLRGGTEGVFGHGARPLAYVSPFDVARCAVLALSYGKARTTIIEIGGPENLTLVEVIRLFAQTTGRPFSIEHVPEAVLQDQVAKASDAYEKSLAALALFIAHGDWIDMHETVQHFPIQMSSIADYVDSVLQPVST